MSTQRFPVEKSDEEWRRTLTPEQYAVLREHATERPGSCALLVEKLLWRLSRGGVRRKASDES